MKHCPFQSVFSQDAYPVALICSPCSSLYCLIRCTSQQKKKKKNKINIFQHVETLFKNPGSMEGYDGWYDEEDPTTSDSTHMGVPSSSGSGGGGGAATGANRKSVVLFDDIVPGPGATAGGEVIPSGGANKDNTSRVFPGRTLAPPRATRNFAHLQEPVYKPEAKAPYIVIALVVMLGSFAMFVIGCICVSDYYVQSIGSGQGALDTCGPAGGTRICLCVYLSLFVLFILVCRWWWRRYDHRWMSVCHRCRLPTVAPA